MSSAKNTGSYVPVKHSSNGSGIILDAPHPNKSMKYVQNFATDGCSAGGLTFMKSQN